MSIPLLAYVYVLNFALAVVTFLAWFAILFTGRYPESMFTFAVGVLRLQWRASTYYLFMREQYPSFNLVTTLADPGDDPATLSLVYPSTLSRGLIFIKAFLVIPVFFVLAIYGIGAYVAIIVGFFSVLFTGSWPEGARNYLIRVSRLGHRALAYYFLLTDVYPGFSLE